MRYAILFIINSILPVLIFAQGSIYKTDDFIRVGINDTLNYQLISAGEWIDISGYLQNDIYAAGKNITVNGTIEDDAFLIGNTISLGGRVSDMLVSAGESILIDGEIGGDLILAGRNLRVTEDSEISGNVFLGGDTIDLHGRVSNGRVRIAGRTITLNGPVGNDVIIYSSNVTFGDSYSAQSGTKIISREPVYRENLGNIPPDLEIEIRKPGILPFILFQLWFFLSLLVTGIILLFLFSEKVKDVHRFSIEHFWKNTGTGVLTFLLVPLVMVILIIPLITIPLSIILGLLYGFSLFISYLLVALVLGLQLMTWFDRRESASLWYLAMAAGLVLIAILTNLPFIGIIFSILLLFFGLGSLSSYIWHSYRLNTSAES